jgi:4-hydroxy-tetrahydrodipicolinate synthase
MATPFTAGGEKVDEPALRALTDRTLTAGVHGLVPCGSTGEFPALTDDERRAVTEIVIDQAAGRAPVIVHTGAMTTQQAAALSRHAEQAGAAAIMVVPPYYEPLSTDEIGIYYRDVAASVGIDVMIYNLPMATGVNMSPEDIAALAADMPNIRYVKDTSGNFGQAAQLLHQYGSALTTFVGWDTLYLGSLTEGARGSVIGAANVVPGELVAIYDAIQGGDLTAARTVWDKIFPLMQFFMSGSYVAGIKSALQFGEHAIGDPRLPIQPVRGPRLTELHTILTDISAQSPAGARG